MRKILFTSFINSLLSVLVIAFLIEKFIIPSGPRGPEEIVIFIPEGKSVVEINHLITSAGVLKNGESIINSNFQDLEGYLFPDTYRFYASSTPATVVDRFLENFKNKAEPILRQDARNFRANLIIASMVEKEVPDQEDRRLVAGIMKKRLSIGMPLQIDATLCYLKLYSDPTIDFNNKSCYPLLKTDKAVDSDYNTYLIKGLPAGPISNPGQDALKAVIEAKDSPYWFYISDPKTGQTIFSKTFEEHQANIKRYL